MYFTNIRTKSNLYLRSLKNALQDTAGVCLLEGWKQIEKENVEIVDDIMLPEVLRIQAEGFEKERHGEILKHSQKFREIFYVIKSQDKVIGYCIYYLKPELSFKGLKKKSVIYSIAIDREFRNKGFGRKLLEESIREMKLNNVSVIFLYVNIHNVHAIRLYERTGFSIVKEVENICGQKAKCYNMELEILD